jgi:uncharacterized protein DUF6391
MNNSTVFDSLKALLNFPLIDRARRNHGLEHATVTLLTQKYPKIKLAGRSIAEGFYLYGRVSTDDVRAAVTEALRRLNAGDAGLAVHPNCGTNVVTKGIAAGFVSYLTFLGANTRRARLARLPQAAVLAAIAATLAQPLGLRVQEHITTSADMRDLRIVDIRRQVGWGQVTHFITTAG